MKSGELALAQPVAAVGHALDARVALNGLALEGQRNARGPAGGQAFHAADGLDAAVGGELAADAQVGRRVLRRGNHGLRGQHGVPGEGGRVGGLGLGGNAQAGDGQGEQGRGVQLHERVPSLGSMDADRG
jgi:hypothetical protein